VVAAALARWADSYLMTEEAPPSPALAAAYGQHTHGASQAAHVLAGLALAALSRYPGERALHAAAAGRLLAAATRRAALAAALAGAPAWRVLCEAVGRGEPGLLQLEGAVQRRLMQSLLAAAAGWPADGGAWAAQLLGAASEQLRQLGASEAAARAALQLADGLHLLTSLLERLRGAVRGTLPPTQPAIFQQARQAAEPCSRPDHRGLLAAASLARLVALSCLPWFSASHTSADAPSNHLPLSSCRPSPPTLPPSPLRRSSLLWPPPSPRSSTPAAPSPPRWPSS
jgi:hypothetical protein